MYEVEIKVELTAEEKEKLLNEFRLRDFQSRGITPQKDFYIEAKKSPYGGLDLKRYRNEAGKCIYTEKIWEVTGDTRARRENEREVTFEEMEAEIDRFPNALKIQKDREWFSGKYKDFDISLTIDSVQFDHSPGLRYFVEAEVGVSDKDLVKETKRMIANFLAELLEKTDSILEAPGMFTMVMDKR